MPLLHQITIRNLLSFGEKGVSLALRPLNVLIGPNGAGKSNLVDVIGLLQAAPRNIERPILESGGNSEWFNKSAGKPIAQLEAIVGTRAELLPFRHSLEFQGFYDFLRISEESIEHESRSQFEKPFYQFKDGAARLASHGAIIQVNDQGFKLGQSILSQRKDPDHYPELASLAAEYERIRIYREWSVGRESLPRTPQRTDQRNDYLDERCSNLGMVLNKLRRDPAAKSKVLEWLQRAYEGINDFDVIIEGGSVQVFLQEGSVNIPATRLSDGTLRYLCLLAILCHPNPPPLVCIEEPELGLHPDLVVAVGELLKEASERSQLIVTTHSAAILDVLSRTPEDVIVCEKENGESVLTRLDAADLAVWMDEYSLGQLWRRGEIGGNRW